MKSKTFSRTLGVSQNRVMSQWHITNNTLRLRLLQITDGAVTRFITTKWLGKNVHRPIKFAYPGRQADIYAWSARSHGPQAACATGIVSFECRKSLAISGHSNIHKVRLQFIHEIKNFLPHFSDEPQSTDEPVERYASS